MQSEGAPQSKHVNERIFASNAVGTSSKNQTSPVKSKTLIGEVRIKFFFCKKKVQVERQQIFEVLVIKELLLIDV